MSESLFSVFKLNVSSCRPEAGQLTLPPLLGGGGEGSLGLKENYKYVFEEILISEEHQKDF